jgi:hypothetical protein
MPITTMLLLPLVQHAITKQQQQQAQLAGRSSM